MRESIQEFFFFQAEDGIRDYKVTGVQTCALPIYVRQAAERLQGPRPGPGLRLLLLIEELDQRRSEERRVGKEWRYRKGEKIGRKKGRERDRRVRGLVGVMKKSRCKKEARGDEG